VNLPCWAQPATIIVLLALALSTAIVFLGGGFR
jgi:hypothetical protein